MARRTWHHDGPALAARGHHHMLQDVAALRFGVHHDHVGLDLVDALGQKTVAWQGRHDVVARLQQGDAQDTGPLQFRGFLRVWFGGQSDG